MGQYDIVVIGGVAILGGWYFITHPEILQSLFPPVSGNTGGGGDTGGGTDTTGDTSGGTSTDNTKTSSSSSACKNYCANCACRSYNEKCSGSCSKCSGGNRIPSKCGLGGSTSDSGSFSGTSSGSSSGNSSKSADCAKFCNNGWCESYRSRGCSGGCSKCKGVNISGSSGGSCPSHVSGNCGGDCHKTCWHGRSGSQVFDSCVSQAYSTSACAAARAKFCANHGPCSSNLARVYKTYPYEEAMRITIV